MMSWLTSTANADAIRGLAALFTRLSDDLRALRLELANLDQNLTRLEKLQTQDARRFDALLQQFVTLAQQKNAPPPITPQDPLAGLSLFEEVPLGDKAGYKEEELSLGAEYQETKES